MAEMQKGKARWPGASTVFGASYTCQWGTLPSVATVTVPLSDQTKVQRIGDLVFSDDVHQPLRLTDCIIDRWEVTNSVGGKALSLTILDRRWRWRFGTFSGRYNLRDSRGIIIDKAISPKQIAEKILKAMGEENYLIDLPNGFSQNETPFIEFDEVRFDHALEEIAAKFSRVVVFQPLKNRVIITQIGEGQPLPPYQDLEISASFDAVELPKEIEIKGAPVAYQYVFRLLPAARNLDGAIVPIDNAEYRPTAGWGYSKARAFRDITVPAVTDPTTGVSYGVATREEVIETAASCIWKYFRFSSNDVSNAFKPKETTFPSDEADNLNLFQPLRLWVPDPPKVGGQIPLQVPGLNEDAPGLVITTPYQLDFLDGVLYAHPTDPTFKPFFNSGPLVFGEVYKGAVPFFNPFRPNDLTIPTDSFRSMTFQVDNDRKIIIADRYLYNVDSSNPLSPVAVPPTLYCVISFHVRDAEGKLVRYSKKQTIDPSSKTRPLTVIKEDAKLVRMVDFDRTNWTVKARSSNREAVDKILDFYMQQEIQRLRPRRGDSKTMAGIITIDPDGAIKQVTWKTGDLQPTTTTASRDTEHMLWLPSFEQRLFQQRQKAFIDRPVNFISRQQPSEPAKPLTPSGLPAGYTITNQG